MMDLTRPRRGRYERTRGIRYAVVEAEFALIVSVMIGGRGTFPSTSRRQAGVSQPSRKPLGETPAGLNRRVMPDRLGSTCF